MSQLPALPRSVRAFARLPALALLPPLAMFVVLLWGSWRGIDLTDEGYYLMAIDGAHVGVSSFGGLVRNTLSFIAADVIGLRLARLALATCAALVLAWGAFRWSERGAPEPWARGLGCALTAAALAGTYLAWIGLPPTFSYNSLNNVFLVVSAGLVLRFLGHTGRGEDGDRGNDAERGAARRVHVDLIVVGALVALQVFTKFSTGLTHLLGIGLLLSLHARSLTVRGVVRAGLSLAAGLVVGAVLHSVFAVGVAEWLEAFERGTALGGTTSHSTSDVLARYLWDLRLAAVRVPLRYGLAGLLAVVAGATAHRRTRRWVIVSGVFTLASLAAVIWTAAREATTTSHTRRIGDATYAYLALGMCCLLALVVLRMARRRGGAVARESAQPAPDPERPAAPHLAANRPAWTWFERVATLGYLVALPVCGSLGTNLHLLHHALQHAAPFLVAIVLLGFELVRAGAPRWTPIVLSGALGVLASGQLALGYVVEPFRLPTALPGQRVVVESPRRLAGLRLDSDSVQFFAELEGMARGAGHRPGDPILAFFELGTVVFALEGTAPGAPALYASAPERTRLTLETLGSDAVGRCFVLVEDRHAQLAADLLRGVGRVLEDDRLVGVVPCPYRPGNVTLYAPR